MVRSADDQTFLDDIEAYCGRLSCDAGDLMPLHVSTRAATFDVVVQRWGAQKATVWEQTGVTGTFHEVPAGADSNGCNWPVTLQIPVGEWASGFHLVTLTAHGAAEGREVAHACFVVRPPRGQKRPGRALLVLATNTWNAYNTWGGMSLYTGGREVSFSRPFGRGMLARPDVDRDDRKARPRRRGEDHDVDGMSFQTYRTAQDYPAAIGSTGWFTYERRFTEWAEAAGYQLDFAISADLETPGLLDDHDLVLSVGHDEYWSAPMRDAVEGFVGRGGTWASFSGNTMFWQVRLEDAERLGAPERMVCHKYSAHETDPLVGTDREREISGLWADPVIGRPEWEFLGASSAWGLYHRFGQATPRASGAYTVYRHDHWLFEGTGLRYGDVLGADDGVVGYETVGCRLTFDEFQQPIPAPHHMALSEERFGKPTQYPANTVIVAFAPASNLGVGEYPKSISALSDQGDLEFMAERLYGRVDEDSKARIRHGNSVMLVTRPEAAAGSNSESNGEPGEVIIIGSTDWTFGLPHDPAVAQVTANVLNRVLG